MISASAPPRVRARLLAAGVLDSPVLHRGPDAVYVDVDGWCVGVVGRRATAVPCALRTRLDHLPAVRTAAVRDGVLRLDGQPVVIGRLVDVRVPRIDRSGAPGAIDVAGMVGRGDGLTPYGDDVLCGWLAVHRAAGVATPAVDAAVRDRLHRTTLLSATLIDCALRGEVIPEFASYLMALGTEAEPERAALLAAVGHSSGRGLLEGACLALASLAVAAA